MRRAAGGWAWLVLGAAVLLPARARGGVLLDAESRGAGTMLEVLVTNGTADPVTAVTPEVTFAHATTSGAAATLSPGESRTWLVPLAPPGGAGVYPATVRVRYRAGTGRAASAVLALPVPTAGASAPVLTARLEVGPLARSGGVQLALENRAPRPVAGRAALVTPDRLRPSPESQPAEVPAGGRSRVPFVLENVEPDVDEPAPVFGVVEYEIDGVHHTVVAEAEAAAAPGQDARRRRPLLVGLAALVTCLALLGIALRRAQGRRPAAEGRPDAASADRTATPPPPRR